MLSARTVEDLTVVTAAGEFDLANAGELRAYLNEAISAGTRHLVVTASETTSHLGFHNHQIGAGKLPLPGVTALCRATTAELRVAGARWQNRRLRAILDQDAMT
jgi:hypothetical protein